MKHRALACIALALGLFAPHAGAQGADDCSQAQPISGTGTYAFDNTAATLDGLPHPLCLSFGMSDLDRDIWFAWTAPTSNVFTLETCGQTVGNTRVAVYDGSCAGSILTCDDDSCSLQNKVFFGAVSGQTYLVRIGVFPGAPGWTGTFSISEAAPVFNPANDNYYMVVTANRTWEQAKQASELITFMGLPGHLVTLSDTAEDQYVYGVLAGGPLGNAWLGGFQNMSSPSYSEPAGGWEWVTGEPFAYTNWLSGEPNDGGGNEHYLGYWPADQWNDYTLTSGTPGAYVIEWDTGAPVGTNYCIAVPNSTGLPALISGSGSASVGLNNLTLTAEPTPAFQNGVFFYGPEQTQVPFGNGFRCVGPGAAGIARLGIVNGGSGGVLEDDLDLTLPPTAATQITAGSTWNFSAWYRDPMAGGAFFNLSDGLEITFVP